MTTYYLDTSALLKGYVPETGTAWILALTKGLISGTLPHDEIVTAVITVAEGGAALGRRQRMGEITLGERVVLFDRFLTDCRSRYNLLSVDELTVYRAAKLTQIYPLRGYDAVHLATALVLHDQLVAARLPAPIFVAADANLCAVARAEGLSAENPNDYP